jgi:hypothetical protein
MGLSHSYGPAMASATLSATPSNVLLDAESGTAIVEDELGDC